MLNKETCCIIAVLLLVVILYSREKLRPGIREGYRPGMNVEGFRPGVNVTEAMRPGIRENLSVDDERQLNWSETLAKGLGKGIEERQSGFVNNTKRFGGSAAREFVVEDIGRTQSSVNYMGLKRPVYIPVRETNPQQPEEDTEVFKMNKRVLI